MIISLTNAYFAFQPDFLCEEAGDLNPSEPVDPGYMAVMVRLQEKLPQQRVVLSRLAHIVGELIPCCHRINLEILISIEVTKTSHPNFSLKVSKKSKGILTLPHLSIFAVDVPTNINPF